MGVRKRTRDATLVIATSALCVTLMACGEKPSNPLIAANPIPTADPHQTRITELESEITKLTSEKSIAEYKIAVLEHAIDDFQDLKSRCQTSPLFCNPINQTLDELQKWHDGLTVQAGMYVPLDLLTEAEIPSEKGMDYMTFHSAAYWKQLGSSLASYGYLESGKLSTDRNVFLMAKGFCEAAFPTDLYLIQDGKWRGFFTKNNGDLLIPGKTLYEEIFAGRRKQATFKTTPAYFKTQVTRAEDLLEAGNTTESIRAFTEFVAHPLAPQRSIAFAQYNLGYALQQQHDWVGALGAYTSSIQASPIIVEAYTRRAMVYEIVGEKNKAMDDLTVAIGMEKDTARKQNLLRILGEIRAAK